MFEDIIEKPQEKTCGTCDHSEFISKNVGHKCIKSLGLVCALNLNKPYKFWTPKEL